MTRFRVRVDAPAIAEGALLQFFEEDAGNHLSAPMSGDVLTFELPGDILYAGGVLSTGPTTAEIDVVGLEQWAIRQHDKARDRTPTLLAAAGAPVTLWIVERAITRFKKRD